MAAIRKAGAEGAMGSAWLVDKDQGKGAMSFLLGSCWVAAGYDSPSAGSCKKKDEGPLFFVAVLNESPDCWETKTGAAAGDSAGEEIAKRKRA